jgi:hypothetical protein
MRLTAKDVKALTKAGKYYDGDGLLLHVINAERRMWFFRYQRNGKERMMGLGSAAVVSLDNARLAALAARQSLARGVDPIDQREAERDTERQQEAARTTFATVAGNYLAAHEAGWRNPKHRQQWRNTLATYANPVIGGMAIADITVHDVLKVLTPSGPPSRKPPRGCAAGSN